VQASSNGNIIIVFIALLALGAGAYYFLGRGEDDNKGSAPSNASSQGIAITTGQPQTQAQTQRPAQQPQTVPQPSGGDQIVTANWQFTQTLVRSDGACPGNVPAPGQDFSPRTTTKVTINKTKRTIQIENSDGTKSEVATYDAVTGLALITYQGAQDNRSSLVKVTDTAIDGESTVFPYRGRQGAEQYSNCRFVLKTTAKVA
jgi:hypothetical protein